LRRLKRQIPQNIQRIKGIPFFLSIVFFIFILPPPSFGYKRVISLSPQITESIFLLGADGYLIADTIFCKRPAGAHRKIKIGTPLRPDIEKIVSLMPDMVLGSKEGNPFWLMERLKRLGINTHYFKRPRDFKELSDNFLVLGRMLQRGDKAIEIIKKAGRGLERQNSHPPFKVLWQVGSDPFIAATNTSFVNDIIRYGGGINIIETGAPYSRINIEEVVKKRPDVIVLMDMGYNIEGEINRWRVLLGDPEFLIIDPYVASSPTPLTFVEAVEKLRVKGASLGKRRK